MSPRLSLLALACVLSCGPALASPSGVVVSQVYGGGGNTGATLKNDFIELLNAGSAPVSLAGWSVQYGSSTGSTWQSTPLTSVVLQPGQYYLVQQAAGTGGTQNLPTPDATGSIFMSGSAGKVALVRSTTLLSGAQPVSADLEDLVGYGSANGYETAPTTFALTNTTAAERLAAGCTDTNSNAADYAAIAPTPRNTAAALATCGGSVQDVAIPAIQGTGATSPYVGDTLRTTGVVTRVNNNGFFLQDPVGDGNALSSDGLFVFTGSAPTVVAGQLLRVTGTVAEFNTGSASNADTAAHPVTELSGVSSIELLGTGPAIVPAVVTLPEAANDELERYEGMLVTLAGPLTVSQNYFLGRYGQLTLSVGGRMEVPTNRHRPGAAAQALADENARRRILLDDGTSQQNPNPTPYIAADGTVRAGDTVAQITGVVDYGLATASNTGFGDYKLHPTEAVSFDRANPREAVPAAVGGNVRVTSFNVLNYFTTFTNGDTADGLSGQGCTLGGVSAPGNCRGANNLAEFQRQQTKIVEALAALNADVVGLMEIQNNGGTAVGNLVAALNAKMGAGTWAAVPDPVAGTGDDAIKVAMIYRPARLALSGGALSDTDAINNRPTLAQTLQAANGERFTVFVNHFKSKSCSDASGADLDQGDGQGCYNSRRIAQAQRLASFVGQVQGSSGVSDVVLLGDLNSYAKEDPMDVLATAGFTDEVGRFSSFGYGYVFDGAAGRLDQALTSPSLSAKVASALEWHINADEPSVLDYNTEFKQPLCATCGPDLYTPEAYRSSDHDPVLLGLVVVKQIVGTPGKDTLLGSPGDDQFFGAGGKDKLTGGAGANVYVYASLGDKGDTLTDFVSGKDLVDLRSLMAAIGYTGTDPVADGVLRLKSGTKGALLQVDADGSGTAAKWTTLLTFKGLSTGQIDLGQDVVVQTPALRTQVRR